MPRVLFYHNIKQTRVHIEDTESQEVDKILGFYLLLILTKYVFSHACLSVSSRRIISPSI